MDYVYFSTKDEIFVIDLDILQRVQIGFLSDEIFHNFELFDEHALNIFNGNLL